MGTANSNRISTLVALAAYLSSVGCDSSAWREGQLAAATAAIEHALKIRPVLQQSRTCPAELEGWKPDPHHGRGILSTQAGNALLLLECDQQLEEFSVAIRYSFDDLVYVAGPFDGPLTITYGHHTAYKTKEIPENPDTLALAKLLAFDRS